MNDKELSALKALAEAATPQNFDSAAIKREGGYMDCPTCGGEGAVDVTTDYCNYDGVAIGAAFYGIGPEHLTAEKYYRAANPQAILSLISRVEQAEAASTERANNAIDQTILSMQSNATPARDVGGLTDSMQFLRNVATDAASMLRTLDIPKAADLLEVAVKGIEREVLATKEAEPDLTAVRLAVLEEAAQACEHVMDECRDKNSGKWPEMQEPSDMGAGYCVDAVQALKKRPVPETIRALATSPAPRVKQEAGELPAILFDGNAVYDEITARLGKGHCFSADAVSTTLDAVVRLMRKSAAPSASQGEVKVLRAALERIARWHGEFPAVTSEDGTATSYGAAYGSNGERDYMRQVALNALAAAPAPSVMDGGEHA